MSSTLLEELSFTDISVDWIVAQMMTENCQPINRLQMLGMSDAQLSKNEPR